MADPNFTSDELTDIFRRVAEFRAMSDDGVRTLTEATTIRVFERGESMVLQDEVPDWFGIVLRGHVRAVHYTAGGRPITVLVAWPGDACGIMAAQARLAIEADFEAAEKSTVACVPVSALHEVLDREPAATRAMLDQCAAQLYEAIRVVKSLTVDVGSRVARFLMRRVEEAEASGSDASMVGLGISRVELAAQLGTVPETLSRAFSSLEDEGLIRADRRMVTILDEAALRRRAAGGLPGSATAD